MPICIYEDRGETPRPGLSERPWAAGRGMPEVVLGGVEFFAAAV
jgi:hypothetical protein